MIKIPRWIILATSLFVCMFMSWFVYDRYNDQPSLKHVTAVLTNITEQDTQIRQQQIRDYLRKSNRCPEAVTGASKINTEIRNLVTNLDGQQYFFQKIRTQTGK